MQCGCCSGACVYVRARARGCRCMCVLTMLSPIVLAYQDINLFHCQHDFRSFAVLHLLDRT